MEPPTAAAGQLLHLWDLCCALLHPRPEFSALAAAFWGAGDAHTQAGVVFSQSCASLTALITASCGAEVTARPAESSLALDAVAWPAALLRWISQASPPRFQESVAQTLRCLLQANDNQTDSQWARLQPAQRLELGLVLAEAATESYALRDSLLPHMNVLPRGGFTGCAKVQGEQLARIHVLAGARAIAVQQPGEDGAWSFASSSTELKRLSCWLEAAAAAQPPCADANAAIAAKRLSALVAGTVACPPSIVGGLQGGLSSLCAATAALLRERLPLQHLPVSSFAKLVTLFQRIEASPAQVADSGTPFPTDVCAAYLDTAAALLVEAGAVTSDFPIVAWRHRVAVALSATALALCASELQSACSTRFDTRPDAAHLAYLPAIGERCAVSTTGLCAAIEPLPVMALLPPVVFATVAAISFSSSAAFLLLCPDVRQHHSAAFPFCAPLSFAADPCPWIFPATLVENGLREEWSVGSTCLFGAQRGTISRIVHADDPWLSLRVRFTHQAGEVSASPWDLIRIENGPGDPPPAVPSSCLASAGCSAIHSEDPHDDVMHDAAAGVGDASPGKATTSHEKVLIGCRRRRSQPARRDSSDNEDASPRSSLTMLLHSFQPQTEAIGDTRLDSAEAIFMRRYTSFWATRGGAPRVPILARSPLELWPAFSEVCARGGATAVTASKQWADVARALPTARDPSVSTAVSYALRVAYTKVLLPFEEFCRERDG